MTWIPLGYSKAIHFTVYLHVLISYDKDPTAVQARNGETVKPLQLVISQNIILTSVEVQHDFTPVTP